MTNARAPSIPLADPRVPVRSTLSALWVAVMFLYVYVDILGFYKPGTVDGIGSPLPARSRIHAPFRLCSIIRGCPYPGFGVSWNGGIIPSPDRLVHCCADSDGAQSEKRPLLTLA